MTDDEALPPTQEELPFEQISFEGGRDLGAVDDLVFDTNRETMWASVEQMAELFGQSPENIITHIRQIFAEAELDEATTINMFPVETATGEQYRIIHYNLDVIISVGYRVSSKQATEFRKWATDVLKSYVLHGYALNEERLTQDSNALKGIAAEIRRLRSRERNIYDAVRSCFATSSSDYNSKSQVTRTFYAKLQDKFLYAITGNTASEVILKRANGLKDLMGLTSTKSGHLTKSDARVGKNYLESSELYELHILCEQFLLFAESKALRGQSLTMQQMSDKFDELLEVQGYSVFKNYDTYLKARAMKHADQEFQRYKQRTRLEQKAKKPSKT